MSITFTVLVLAGKPQRKPKKLGIGLVRKVYPIGNFIPSV